MKTFKITTKDYDLVSQLKNLALKSIPLNVFGSNYSIAECEINLNLPKHKGDEPPSAEVVFRESQTNEGVR